MKISVQVKTNKKQIVLRKISEAIYEAELTVPARDNKANQQLRKLIADFYHVSISRVTIISGKTYKKKILEIV